VPDEALGHTRCQQKSGGIGFDRLRLRSTNFNRLGYHPMVEWLILLLLIPAIVVPIIMLVGFAGCAEGDRVDLDPRTGQTGVQEFAAQPIIVSAVGKSVSIITLKWTYDNDLAETKFEIERTRLVPPNVIEPPIFVEVSYPYEVDDPPSVDDPPLFPSTSYLYRVRAGDKNAPHSEWSDYFPAFTLSFETTFDAHSDLTLDEEGWEGRCLVQRIEPARLMLSGTQVMLTLRASSTNGASIDRIYMSQPASGGEEWQPGPDLKQVLVGPFSVPANGPFTFSPSDYDLKKDKALLVAIDFTPAASLPTSGPKSGIKYAENVSESDATAFYKEGAAEAAQSPRSHDYTPVNRIYLIDTIFVG
jgi:hypothetical protein